MDPNLGKVIQIKKIKKKKCFLRYLQDLEEKGYAIIPNVIEEELLEKHRQQMWKMLYTLTSKWEVPIEENNPKSYRGFYDFFPLHSMLLQHWEVGQSQLSWDIRQNPKVIQCFEKIFSTSELLVSYDGMSIHFPPEITGRGWWNKHWFHTDQNFYIPGRKAIQGQVNLYDVREGDATLVVLEKSHLFHSEISRNFVVDPKQNFLKLSEDQMNFYLQNGCTEKRIQCPAGSLVLWDSRTIHYGSEPLKERKTQNMRCAVYVCYLPKSECPKSQRLKRQKYFDEMRMTTHWPYPVKVFSKRPHTYDKIVPEIQQLPRPILNEVGMGLI